MSTPTRREMERAFEQAGRDAALRGRSSDYAPGPGHALANERRAWLRGFYFEKAKELPRG